MIQLLGLAVAMAAQNGGATNMAGDVTCRASRRGDLLVFQSPAFTYTVNTSGELKSVSWENRMAARKISLGGRPEVTMALDAASQRIFITGWKLASGEPGRVQPDDEGGLKLGCAKPEYDDSGWLGRTSPMTSGNRDSADLSDYYWARTHFALPTGAEAKKLSLVLGGFGMFDYRYMRVFVNGNEIGVRRALKRWNEPAAFELGPGTAAHDYLHYGGDNVLALQLAGFKCRTAKLNELDPERQRDLPAYYYYPGQFEQYLVFGQALKTPPLHVTGVEIVNGKGNAEARVDLAAVSPKITATVTYKWNSREPVLHKFVEIRNGSGKALRLMEVRLADFATAAKTSEGEQGFPVYIDDRFFATLAHPAGWATGQDGKVVLRHYPGKRLAVGERFQCMEAVLGTAKDGQARKGFLKHLESRIRRTVRSHDKPYAIFETFGSWNPEDWWGATEALTLASIKNVMAPEMRQSGCQYDFATVELWRDPKGDIERPDPARFPNGFGRISDELAKLGVDLALWNAVSGPASWTCGENPKLRPDIAYDPAYGSEVDWLCIAEEPLKGMFTQAFVNHIRNNRMRLIKMDGICSICYNPHHKHLPGVYSTEAIWNAFGDITRRLDRECPELFIMLYWGARSPWLLQYGDTLFEPGINVEAAHPSAAPAPYIRDSITVGLDQAHWFCEDTPKLGKDSLGVWLATWGWNSGVGKERWQEGMIMDIARGNLLAQPWSDDGSLTDDERRQMADFIALLKARPECFRNSQFVLGNPWKYEPYGYFCTDGKRGFAAIDNCTWSDQAVELNLGPAWGLPAGRKWELYRWYPEPARLTRGGRPFEKAANVTLGPFDVALFEVVPEGEEPSLGRAFAQESPLEAFHERSVEIPVSSATGKADTKRTFDLALGLPPSKVAGMIVLTVEMRRAGAVVNLAGNGANFTESAMVDGQPVEAHAAVSAKSFPCPWQAWRIAVSASPRTRKLTATVVTGVAEDIELIWRAHLILN